MAEKNNQFELSNRVFILIIVLAVGLMAFWSFRMYEIWKTSTGSYPREITVEGEGKALITPDLAIVNLGVTTDAKTSAQVVADNTKKMNAVITTLKDLGIDEKNIQTTNYNLSPKYDYTPERGSFEDGYTISQNLQVRVKEFEKLGDILAKTTEAGANTVGGINFTLENKDKVKQEAREEAIAKAKESAKQISEVTGLKFGRIIGFYEYFENPGYFEGYGAAEKSISLDASSPPMIEPGQEEMTLKVSLTYRVR